MPSALPVTLDGMNYACIVFVGGLSISLLYYFVHGRHHYVGPPTEGGTEEVTRRRSTIRY